MSTQIEITTQINIKASQAILNEAQAYLLDSKCLCQSTANAEKVNIELLLIIAAQIQRIEDRDASPAIRSENFIDDVFCSEYLM